MIGRAEILDPIEPRCKGEGQRTRVFTINTTRGEAAAPANRLPFFVSQKTARRVVDVAKGSFVIENDDCIIELIDDVEPRPTQNIAGDLFHALITADGS